MLKEIRKKRADPALMEIILGSYQQVPVIYRADHEFSKGLHALDRFKIKTAVKHIARMAGNSDHFFSVSFWQDLLHCASKLEMPKTVSRCEEQLERIRRELKFNTPSGWTTQKIDDLHFQHYLAEADVDKPAGL